MLANAVAPLLMTGVAAAVVWPTIDPRMSFELALNRTTIYTVPGACVAGVAVALLVGWATLLLVRRTNEP